QEQLEQLARGRLEVREQADLFEGPAVEVLRLVENQDRVLPRAAALDEEVVEGEEPLRLRAAGRGDAEVLQDVLEDALERQEGVEDEGRLGGRVERLQERLQQRGFARPHFGGEDDETPALLHAVEELGERFLVTRGGVEKPRVRRGVKRFLA